MFNEVPLEGTSVIGQIRTQLHKAQSDAARALHDLIKVQQERDDLRSQLKDREDTVISYRAKVEELNAELEKLKPKPMITVKYCRAQVLISGAYGFHTILDQDFEGANFRLIFEDRILTKAEVRQPDGSWK